MSCAAAACVVLAGCGGAATSSVGAIGAGLQGPDGVKAGVYATGLLHVSAFAFDARGRLWAAASGASAHGRDGIFVVARAGARPVKMISGLKGPLGLVWHDGVLYVSSLGRVTAFSELHGARFGKRTTILRGPAGGGENNNLVLAPNGRLLLGVSASCDHCTPSTRWSGSIVSFRTDGSDLRLFAGGIRAPFGLAFRPGTSDLYVSMNQRDDLGSRTPGDWLALVRSGENWRFPACYGQKGAACAGVPKPVAVLEPHAAAGGVAFVRGAALVSEWQLGKVLRISRDGTVSTYLTGLKNPLPLLTAADGSVLVGDWGTGKVYRIAYATTR